MIESNSIPKPSSFLSQFLALSIKEFRIQKRYPVNLISIFIMNFFIISVFTVVMQLFIDPTSNSKNSIQSNIANYMFWGFLCFNLLQNALFSIGNSLRFEQQIGTLETLFLYPLNQLANLLSKIIVGFFINLIAGVFGFFLIEYLTGSMLFSNSFMYGFVLYVFVACQIYGIAFFVAGLSIKLKESIQPMINFGQFVVMIFSSLFVPFSALGPFVIISYVIPISFTIDILRSVLFSQNPELSVIFFNITNLSLESIIIIQWLIVVILSFLLPVGGYKYFIRTIHKGRINGDLTDY